MITDPISDMLSRIRNASLAHLESTQVPLSKLKHAVAKILKEEGFIIDAQVNQESPPRLELVLKYSADQKSAIAGLKRISRPGRRAYVGFREIPKVNNGMGIAILSTSHGILTDRDARKKQIGGEVLCEVW
jgi:small subunit ribosomal protein S8